MNNLIKEFALEWAGYRREVSKRWEETCSEHLELYGRAPSGMFREKAGLIGFLDYLSEKAEKEML